MELPEATATAASPPETGERSQRFIHDCQTCTFLGHFEKHDLYWCPKGGLPTTVIARWGSDGPDYISGLAFADTVPVIAEALRRARERNLEPPPAGQQAEESPEPNIMDLSTLPELTAEGYVENAADRLGQLAEKDAEIERLKAHAKTQDAQIGQLCQRCEDYARAGFAALAGVIPTPEQGYEKDGGPSLMRSDLKRLRDHHRDRYAALQAQLAEAGRMSERRRELLVQWRRNPFDRIAKDRGWHPIEVGEEMSVGFWGKAYTVKRDKDTYAQGPSLEPDQEREESIFPEYRKPATPPAAGEGETVCIACPSCGRYMVSADVPLCKGCGKVCYFPGERQAQARMTYEQLEVANGHLSDDLCDAKDALKAEGEKLWKALSLLDSKDDKILDLSRQLDIGLRDRDHWLNRAQVLCEKLTNAERELAEAATLNDEMKRMLDDACDQRDAATKNSVPCVRCQLERQAGLEDDGGSACGICHGTGFVPSPLPSGESGDWVAECARQISRVESSWRSEGAQTPTADIADIIRRHLPAPAPVQGETR